MMQNFYRRRNSLVKLQVQLVTHFRKNNRLCPAGSSLYLKVNSYYAGKGKAG